MNLVKTRFCVAKDMVVQKEIEPIQAEKNPRSTERLLFIDGIRGLAALAIVFYHTSGHRIFNPPPDGILGFLFRMAQHGNEGVPAFFVISGFVIAQSIGRNRISLNYMVNFIARRLVRLSPPYWVTIAFVMVTTYLAKQVLSDYSNEIPSFGSVLAHIVYLYPFFGYRPILEIFWSLVHIVQFYVFLVLLLAIIQKYSQSDQPSPSGFFFLIGLPAAASAIWLPKVPGLCSNTWYIFCLGVFAYWLHCRWISWWLYAFLFSCVAVALFVHFDSFKLTALLMSLTIILASYFGTLGYWLNGRVMQFLGRISYSLFLIHGTVGWRVLSVGERLTGRELSFALVWFCLAVTCSIFAAYLMFLYVELPSVRLSKRLKHVGGVPI